MTQHSSKITILLVDDEEELRMLERLDFEEHDFSVLEADGGNQAFEMIKSNNIDIILSDVRMPDGNGIELLEKTKRLDINKPVIMLISGYSDVTEPEAFAKGADALFSKPYEPDDIRKSILKSLTPPLLRWKSTDRNTSCKAKIPLVLQDLSHAISHKLLSLGRGGIFVKTNGVLAEVNEPVEFHIEMEKGELKLIKGRGLVRWIKQDPVSKNSFTYGIEFLELADECIQSIISYLIRNKPTAFIPLP